MLESSPTDRFRPEPAEEAWEPETIDGVVGVRIAPDSADRPSSEWIWSSQWLDLVAKR